LKLELNEDQWYEVLAALDDSTVKNDKVLYDLLFTQLKKENITNE